MQKDTFKSYRLAKHSLVIQGARCEVTIPYEDLQRILKEIGDLIATREDPGVPRPRPTLPPLKFGNAPE